MKGISECKAKLLIRFSQKNFECKKMVVDEE